MDDEVPKTNERTEHWTYCSEKGCEILTMLWLPKLHTKAFERQPLICGYCSAKRIYFRATVKLTWPESFFGILSKTFDNILVCRYLFLRIKSSFFPILVS